MQGHSTVSRKGRSFPHTWRYNEYHVDGEVAFLHTHDRHGRRGPDVALDAVHLDRVLRAACWHTLTVRPLLVYARGYARGEFAPPGPRLSLSLHRFIMGVTDPLVMVDHEHGNGLDCRESNMRITDSKGNQNNRRQHRRERQREDALHRLLACTHAAPDCACRRYARMVVVSRRAAA